MLRLDITSVVVPVVVTVTVLGALVVFVFCVPKFKLDGLAAAAGLITVAVMGTVCGLPAALSVSRRFAACVGVVLESAVKLMVMVQALPAARVWPQTLVGEKPVESSPEIEPTVKLLKVTVDFPELVTVSEVFAVAPA